MDWVLKLPLPDSVCIVTEEKMEEPAEFSAASVVGSVGRNDSQQ